MPCSANLQHPSQTRGRTSRDGRAHLSSVRVKLPVADPAMLPTRSPPTNARNETGHAGSQHPLPKSDCSTYAPGSDSHRRSGTSRVLAGSGSDRRTEACSVLAGSGSDRRTGACSVLAGLGSDRRSAACPDPAGWGSCVRRRGPGSKHRLATRAPPRETETTPRSRCSSSSESPSVRRPRSSSSRTSARSDRVVPSSSEAAPTRGRGAAGA